MHAILCTYSVVEIKLPNISYTQVSTSQASLRYGIYICLLFLKSIQNVFFKTSIRAARWCGIAIQLQSHETPQTDILSIKTFLQYSVN